MAAVGFEVFPACLPECLCGVAALLLSCGAGPTRAAKMRQARAEAAALIFHPPPFFPDMTSPSDVTHPTHNAFLNVFAASRRQRDACLSASHYGRASSTRLVTRGTFSAQTQCETGRVARVFQGLLAQRSGSGRASKGGTVHKILAAVRRCSWEHLKIPFAFVRLVFFFFFRSTTQDAVKS